MIEFRMSKSDQMWTILGAVVHKEDLDILIQLWINNGYEFRLGGTVYSEYSDEFKKALTWERLRAN